MVLGGSNGPGPGEPSCDFTYIVSVGRGDDGGHFVQRGHTRKKSRGSVAWPEIGYVIAMKSKA